MVFSALKIVTETSRNWFDSPLGCPSPILLIFDEFPYFCMFIVNCQSSPRLGRVCCFCWDATHAPTGWVSFDVLVILWLKFSNTFCWGDVVTVFYIYSAPSWAAAVLWGLSNFPKIPQPHESAFIFTHHASYFVKKIVKHVTSVTLWETVNRFRKSASHLVVGIDMFSYFSLLLLCCLLITAVMTYAWR